MKKLLVPVVVLLSVALSGPAQAARPLVHEHYSGTDSFRFNDCGFVIRDTVVFEGLFMLKAPREAGEPPLLFDNYESHETLTANGRTMTIDHNGLYKNVEATHVRGTIYQFVSMEVGQPFVMRDGDGDVLLRDRGNLVTTFQVDTKGDSDPSNDKFIDGSFSVLADHGQHPGFYIDFCQVAEDYFFG